MGSKFFLKDSPHRAGPFFWGRAGQFDRISPMTLRFRLFVLTLTLAGVLQAQNPFCLSYMARLRPKIPQLKDISGNREDLTFTLKSWKRGKGGAQGEIGALDLSERIGEA